MQQDKTNVSHDKQRMLREKKEAKQLNNKEKQTADQIKALERTIAQLVRDSAKKDKQMRVMRSSIIDLKQTVQLLASKILK